MNDKSEKRLLKLVGDYVSGSFTMAGEKPLIDEIIKLTSSKLSADDIFEVIFEGDVQTAEEGVAALQSFIKKHNKNV